MKRKSFKTQNSNIPKSHFYIEKILPFPLKENKRKDNYKFLFCLKKWLLISFFFFYTVALLSSLYFFKVAQN